MVGILLIPIIIGFINRHILYKILKIFWIYLISLFIVYLFSLLFIWAVNNYYTFFQPFLTKFNIQNTYFLGILSYTTNILFIGFFYSMVFNSILIKRITIFYFFIAIGIYFFVDGYHEYGSFNSTLLNIFIIILSLMFINKAIKTDLNKTFFKNPIVLISLGLLLPNVIQLLFSLLANDLDKTNFILYVKFKILTNFIDFIGYFLFSMAFLRVSKNLKIR